MAKETVSTKETATAVEEQVAKTPEVLAEEEAKELVQVVVFELDEEEYAVEISEVREILKVRDITPIPNTPDFIEGIINVRGKIVVVLDLEKRFNLERESTAKKLHTIVSEQGENSYGASVDEVTEVLRIPKDSIEPAPAIISEKIQADYVKGIGVLENRLLILLDFTKVFEEKGLSELSELVKKQAKAVRTKYAREKPKEEKEETAEEKKEKVEEMLERRIKGEKPKEKPANPEEPLKEEEEKVEEKEVKEKKEK